MNMAVMGNDKPITLYWKLRSDEIPKKLDLPSKEEIEIIRNRYKKK